MADFLSRLASGFGRGVEMLGTLGTADLFRERGMESNRQLGRILSQQSIPQFARMGGAEPDSPENIREAQMAQLTQLGTPQALEILGKISPMNQSPEKIKALGYLSSVLSQRFGLPAEQVNAMLMGGVEPTALGSLLKTEAQELVQTYDPTTGRMIYTPKSQAAGMAASAPETKDRKIVEQGDIQYYADTGERVIPESLLPKEVSVPIPEYLPQNVPDPTTVFRDKDKAQLELLKQSEDKIKAIEEASSKEQDIIQRLERFGQLLDVQQTGASQAAPFYINPNLREMKSIQSEIAPQMRTPGSGSSSDTDVKMFKDATVSPTNPTKTNRNIITARTMAAKNKIDQATFFREFQSSYGHTKGAESAWKEYLEANPIFDKKASKENIILNPDRVSYKDYFTQKNGGGVTREQALEELKKRGKL